MTDTLHDGLDPLRTESGVYAMLAIDQRESLRGMFGRGPDGAWVDDTTLIDFKRDAIDTLSPHASGILVDRPFTLQHGRPTGIAPACGLIVAADVLHQVPGDLLTHSTVDPQVTPELLRRVGAVAVKFLILWRPDEAPSARSRVLDEFVELAEQAGLPTLIEGVVRAPDGQPWASETERHDAIETAAHEFALYRPAIYKAEMPGYSRGGDVSQVQDRSRRMSEIVDTWVVLSNGVEPEYFADALTEAAAGGAHGFLAGRAVWQDIVTEPATRRRDVMANRGADRLERLTGIVERAASARTQERNEG